MKYLGFWKRLLAYLIDTVPITLVVFLPAYFFWGFDEVMRSYFSDRNDLEARAAFYSQRGLIKNFGFLVYVAYCILMESSSMHATLGKRVVGAMVVSETGEPLTLKQALLRNLLKILSALPLFMGFLMAAFSAKRQALHDKFAKTYVVSAPRKETR
ncbi:RDD family protein [bacterium]|nr:RDD family protein [bacterium]